jgi:hypothetical protein
MGTTFISMIWGAHRGDFDDYDLLGSNTVYFGELDACLLFVLRLDNSSTLKLETVSSSETSVKMAAP